MSEQELELIQKALIIRHNSYISCGSFDDALKITKLLFENQDEAGRFSISSGNKDSEYYILQKIISVKNHLLSWLKVDELLGYVVRIVNCKLT